MIRQVSDKTGDELSVAILVAINDSSWFAEKNSQVVIYHRNSDNELISTQQCAVSDFLNAVDFYIENRDLESHVSMAMQQPEGVVDVFMRSPDGSSTVIRLRNYKVVQILEFAYRLARRT